MRIYAALLILIVASVLMKPYTPHFVYSVQKNYIQNSLCINQDKPEMKCHGKCFLMKQLKEQAENPPGQIEFTMAKVDFLVSPIAQLAVTIPEFRGNALKIDQKILFIESLNEIWRPPRVLG